MIYLILLACGILSAVAEESSQLLKDFAVENTNFSASVYKELLKGNSGNFIVCPLSVEVILALVHAGARENTARELSNGLHLPESSEEVQKIFKELAQTLRGNNDYNLSSANKVYVKDGFQISESFRDVAVNVFDSEVQNIDFLQKDAAAEEMNKWVEERTDEKIKNLISPLDLDENTRAVLINAMYFHGRWVKQFDEYATRKRPFHVNAKTQVETDMMELTDSFNYYESSELNAKFLEMAYEGGDVSMIFILPNEVEGLSALEEKIEEVLVAPKFAQERVNVVIPKFKIETTTQFKPVLQALGVKDAFEDNADFSGIGAKKEPLKISKVVQKAFIEVEEKGTTAAAATAVFLVDRIGTAHSVHPIVFLADRPFIFIIRNFQTGVTLFTGRCAHPLN